MLSKSSKTHEAFFASKANEYTGRINQQYADFHSYFILQDINKQLSAENAALRNQLKADFIMPDSTKKTVVDSLYTDSLHKSRKYIYLPAAVVGNSVIFQNNYLTLERGEKQGVKKGMAVASPQGIVGVVIDVSDNYCRVMSLLHRNSRVSAMLKKDNNLGSIEWDGVDPHYLILKNISKGSKVVKGDTVLTSTYSSNFPSHLMIGTVDGIASDPASNFYTLKVKTATNFFTIQYVNIIENTRFAEQSKLEAVKLKGNE